MTREADFSADCLRRILIEDAKATGLDPGFLKDRLAHVEHLRHLAKLGILVIKVIELRGKVDGTLGERR